MLRAERAPVTGNRQSPQRPTQARIRRARLGKLFDKHASIFDGMAGLANTSLIGLMLIFLGRDEPTALRVRQSGCASMSPPAPSAPVIPVDPQRGIPGGVT
jgi:hypothetical protein